MNSTFEYSTCPALDSVFSTLFNGLQSSTHFTPSGPVTVTAQYMKMHEVSFCTSLKDVIEDDKKTTAWAELLNRKGDEDLNDRIHPKKG